MYLETYPITPTVGKNWSKSNDFAFEAVVKNGLSFLYIGEDEDIFQSFCSSFESRNNASDFLEAQVLVGKFTRSSAPDVIFIDKPLHNAEFQNFCFYLRRKTFLAKTLVIYNENRLDIPRIKLLKQLELVDDVINMDATDINYSSKITFLQKVRMWQQTIARNEEKTVEKMDYVNGFSVTKRFIDIVLSFIAILAFLPFLLVIALVIRLESRGPIIYTSRRAGRGYKVFNFFKFRTMEVDADKKIDQLQHLNQYDDNKNGARFMKICNDPRVTRFGKILRKTSLDELPQLFNVLKGEMSMVGNRPLPLYEASTLTTDESVERFMAPAGITGLWQVKKRGKSEMSVEERITLDISYARKANLLYDLWIIAQTPAALLQKRNV